MFSLAQCTQVSAVNALLLSGRQGCRRTSSSGPIYPAIFESGIQNLHSWDVENPEIVSCRIQSPDNLQCRKMHSLDLWWLRPRNESPIALVRRLYLQPILYLIQGLLADNRYASDLDSGLVACFDQGRYWLRSRSLLWPIELGGFTRLESVNSLSSVLRNRWWTRL